MSKMKEYAEANDIPFVGGTELEYKPSIKELAEVPEGGARGKELVVFQSGVTIRDIIDQLRNHTQPAIDANPTEFVWDEKLSAMLRALKK